MLRSIQCTRIASGAHLVALTIPRDASFSCECTAGNTSASADASVETNHEVYVKSNRLRDDIVYAQCKCTSIIDLLTT